jgi:glycosyltransferase involved in cell wall biosynthesis
MTPDWLLIAGDLVPTGGMDSALLGLASYLALQHVTEVVAHRISPELQAMPNIQFHKVRRPKRSHLLGAPFLANAGRRQQKLYRSQGTRVVCNGGNCPGTDINWVHYVHAAYRPQSAKRGWRTIKQNLMHSFYRWAERKVLRQSAYVVCNSLRSATDVIEKVGVAPDRVRVVYYGADPTRLPPITPDERAEARQMLDPANANRPWVVFIGAMGDHRKGFDTLYNSWRKLAATNNWEPLLWVVGAGTEKAFWEARSGAEGLKHHIRFLGFRDDVPKILAACDLSVHPARYEAYGLSVHEALCRGLPSIVSSSAGVAERYPADLKELLLVNPEDSDEVVDRLKNWLKHLTEWPSRLAPLASSLRARTWNDMAAEFVQAVGGTRR